jgi:2-amino-4-hydroxy-6-hydroxymethyldihydropteridine diphosphokinase
MSLRLIKGAGVIRQWKRAKVADNRLTLRGTFVVAHHARVPISQSYGHPSISTKHKDSRIVVKANFRETRKAQALSTTSRCSNPSFMAHQVEKPELNRVAIALGSNLGDRIANIEAALDKLRENDVTILSLSSLYETKPMYYDDQDPFLNGVCLVATPLDPLTLLDLLQSIENDLGRKRLIDKGPRTIDLDIILYNKQVIKHARLSIPHPLMLEREFVLRPLVE